MAVKDFKNESGYPAFVCNAKGRMWKLDKTPTGIKEQKVIGTDIFPTEEGNILYVWID